MSNKYLEPLQLSRLFNKYISYQVPHTAWAEDSYFKDSNIKNVIENLYTKFIHDPKNNHGQIDFDIEDINEYFYNWFLNNSKNILIKEFYEHLNALGYTDKYTEEWYNRYALKESVINSIILLPGQIVKDIEGNEYKIESRDILVESWNIN
jgi:hypothetical protein